MNRVVIPAVCAAALAACAPRYHEGPPPPYPDDVMVSHHGAEIDYEMQDRVLFRTDSADLSDRAADVIAHIAGDVRHMHHAEVYVGGYTDTVGSAEYNMGLSQARAQSVADALVRDGIDPGRIRARGFGETHLAVPTGDNVSEKRNRRVVIRVVP